MKIACELCGGTLLINAGGKNVTCTACGLNYTMERLREMLAESNSTKQEPPVQSPPEREQDTKVIYDVKEWTEVLPEPEPDRGFDFVPEQFVMSVTKTGADYVSGYIHKGGIGVGDRIYINHDDQHPYTVRCLDDPTRSDAKKGMQVRLYLRKCPKYVLKKAGTVTGDPGVVANAYNYPGTVSEYFSGLLQGTFSGYEIHTDVPHEELDIPVSFLLHKNGKPVLAVFLIHSNDRKARTQVRRAERIFALEGVCCTHFYHNYRNDAPYVIDRVRDVLG